VEIYRLSIETKMPSGVEAKRTEVEEGKAECRICPSHHSPSACV
jgi:hypothetical protein